MECDVEVQWFEKMSLKKSEHVYAVMGGSCLHSPSNVPSRSRVPVGSSNRVWWGARAKRLLSPNEYD